MSPPSSLILLLFLIFSLLIFISKAQSSRRQPNALVLPVSKHHSLQYLTNFSVGTPPVQTIFVVDLGRKNLNITCKIKKQYLASDTIYVPSTNGSSPGQTVKADFILFACAQNHGLAGGADGVVGLGKSSNGLSTQLSSSLGRNFSSKFALCLPSSPSLTTTYSGGYSNKGVLFFGNTRYLFYPSYNESRHIDVTERLSYTKLYVNPTSKADYFVGVTSILINKKPIPINTTLLTIDHRGHGGTKFSTAVPYTVLESSIYKALTEEFVKQLKAIRVNKVAPVAPFTECFSTNFLGYTMIGPGVPDVTFVFEDKDDVYWELNGFNLMVEISLEVVCLAFVDGGLRPKTSVVIGAHQMEDNLLEFDLAASRLGFSYTSLQFLEVLCSNFKF